MYDRSIYHIQLRTLVRISNVVYKALIDWFKFTYRRSQLVKLHEVKKNQIISWVRKAKERSLQFKIKRVQSIQYHQPLNLALAASSRTAMSQIFEPMAGS